MEPLFISNYVLINVLDQLSRTPGVGQANLFSKLNYSMRVWFDTDRLTALSMTPGDIIAAIQAQNVVARSAAAGARPIGNDQQFQFNLQTQGRLVTAQQFGNIVIRANPDGSVLRLRDVARIELGAQNMDSETRLNGRPGVPIGIYLSPGANAVDTAAAVSKTLARLQARFPAGLHAMIMYDSTSFVRDTRTEVLKTLGIAFVLVVAVVFLFLGSVRATIIPMVAVPVSLIGTFAALLALGYTENTVSLLAMVLAVGVVVDDAIVVVENVERVMEEEPDLPPAEAARKAMRQITGPIIAISLVLLSVFVPVGFIPGLSGTLFRQFAVTMSCAMLISAINALTLSPALCGGCSCATKASDAAPSAGCCAGSIMCATATPGWCSASSGLARTIAGGDRAVCRRHRVRFARTTPTGFLPRRTRGVLHSRATAGRRVGGAHLRGDDARGANPQGHAADSGHAVDHRVFVAGWRRVGAECRVHGGADEAVRRSRRRGGFGAGTGRAHVRRSAARSASAVIFPFNLPPIIGLGTAGGFEYQLEALQGQDPSANGSVMQGLNAAANQDPRLTRVFSTFTATNPSLYLDIDRDKAQALGLNISDVFTALSATLGGVYVNNFNLYGRTWQVNIEGRAGRPRRHSGRSGAFSCATTTARWCRCGRS